MFGIWNSPCRLSGHGHCPRVDHRTINCRGIPPDHSCSPHSSVSRARFLLFSQKLHISHENGAMDIKHESGLSLIETRERRPSHKKYALFSACFFAVFLAGGWLEFDKLRSIPPSSLWTYSGGSSLQTSGSYIPHDIVYNLTISQAWRNPGMWPVLESVAHSADDSIDGGRWRPMFVGNSDSPVPVINAREGDLIHLNVHNDLGVPSALHWYARRLFVSFHGRERFQLT